MTESGKFWTKKPPTEPGWYWWREEFQETVALANKILDRPFADPDADEAMLARQFLRQTEIVQRLKADLTAQHDPYVDLVNANRDEILRKHEEAIRRISFCIRQQQPELAYQVIQALSQFHPMHGESWCGWPEGSEA